MIVWMGWVCGVHEACRIPAFVTLEECGVAVDDVIGLMMICDLIMYKRCEYGLYKQDWHPLSLTQLSTPQPA